MPTELLAFPIAYPIVGLYRLATDASVRGPVLAKVEHAAIRGAIVGGLYAVFGWGFMDWVVKKWFVGGRAGERTYVGIGKWGFDVDLVLYTHIIILLPQLTALMKFFIRKNLRIAKTRAYNLTVSSRKKPAEFWSQGYIEEWAAPPVPTAEQKRAVGAKKHRATWVSWALWWPVQLLWRQWILAPLSPALPLLSPLVICSLRALATAEYLHQPYFIAKHMSADEQWRWIEERKWAYRSFGFAASFLEGLPIIGFYLSISNRIGAAMWAHDLEKRQHLFGHGVLKPLPRDQVGLFGSGNGLDQTADVVRQENEIEAKWSARHIYQQQREAIESGPEKNLLAPAGDEKKIPPPLPPRSPAKKVPPPRPPRQTAHAGL